MSLIIITILLALFAILSIKKTVWGVFLISALLPTYLIRFQLAGVSSTLLEGMIIVLLLVFLVRQIVRKKLGLASKESLRCKFAFPALLLLVAATIAVFVAPDRLAALGLWKAYFVEPILLLFVFVNVVETKKQLRQAIVALAASATFIALTAIVQYFTGWGIPESYDLVGARRATSFYGYPAAVGLFIAPILSLVLAFIISNGKKVAANYKLWLPAGLAVCAMTLALVFAKTEGAWLGVLAATFFALLFTKYRLKIIILSLVAIIILLAIPVTREYIVTLATFQDVSGEVRLVLWQGTARLLANNPIFGAGLAGFPALYEQYKEARHVELSLYPHNIFLNFWVETGVLGLIALLLTVWQYFKRGIKNLGVSNLPTGRQVYALPLLAAMICILVYGLVDAPYFKNDLAMLFWILMGMMIVTGNVTKNEKPA
ncbi:O-antigen ligase family protein [Patescibacteria group bacterium]|nr:O-antigen ligase family protein [Patescibacteria group bacterium]